MTTTKQEGEMKEAINKITVRLETGLMDLEYANQQVAEQAQVLIGRAERVKQYVADGLNVSNEIQGAGSELDRLCAVREEKAKALRSMIQVGMAVGTGAVGMDVSALNDALIKVAALLGIDTGVEGN